MSNNSPLPTAGADHTPTLPSAPEIERIILGALLLREDSAQITRLSRDLHGSDFAQPSHRQIFETLVEMAEHGDPISSVLLLHRLKAKGSHVAATDIAALVDGVPHYSDLSRETQILKDTATRREIMRCADAWIVKAQAPDVDVADLARAIATRAADFGRYSAKELKPISYDWGELCEMKIERREAILHEVERGEIVMCPAITNRGKTTLWRNIAVSLASGRPFAPIAKAGPPRSVLYLDFETRLYKARADLSKMLGQLSQPERALISQNFHLICDCRIEDRPLTLSNPRHLEIVEEEARRIKADVLIIDTLTAAFEIENENDNAESARVMKKLTGLAQRLNCVVVFLHHVGKAKQEEGQTMHAVHRARGGSAYSGFSHAIFNLLPDPMMREKATLECAKVKGERFEDTVLILDQQTRWFAEAGTVIKPISPYEKMLAVFNGKPLKRAAIQNFLPDLKRATLDRYLRSAVEAGELVKHTGGLYQKTESSQSSHAYRYENFEDLGESVEPIGDSLHFNDLPDSEIENVENNETNPKREQFEI